MGQYRGHRDQNAKNTSDEIPLKLSKGEFTNQQSKLHQKFDYINLSPPQV